MINHRRLARYFVACLSAAMCRAVYEQTAQRLSADTGRRLVDLIRINCPDLPAGSEVTFGAAAVEYGGRILYRPNLAWIGDDNAGPSLHFDDSVRGEIDEELSIISYYEQPDHGGFLTVRIG